MKPALYHRGAGTPASSVKQTLIFYDKAGVFCPREKDPHNGYRYYTEDQLELLDHILMLQGYGHESAGYTGVLALPDMGERWQY